MTHLKRERVPKSWPIHRKGTAYVVRSDYSLERGVPLLIFFRDMLKVAANRKEVKRAIHLKKIMLNGKLAKDEKNSITLFDKISIPSAKKFYQLGLNTKGKYIAEEIKEKEVDKKTAKIIGKKILKGKKVQVNLNDGRNFLSDVSCNVEDSAVINFKDKKIEKCIPIKEKTKVIVYAGKHFGKKGTIEKIKKERQMVTVDAEGQKINVLIKQVMAIE